MARFVGTYEVLFEPGGQLRLLNDSNIGMQSESTYSGTIPIVPSHVSTN